MQGAAFLGVWRLRRKRYAFGRTEEVRAPGKFDRLNQLQNRMTNVHSVNTTERGQQRPARDAPLLDALNQRLIHFEADRL